MLTFAKRVVIGRPLASSEMEHQRLPKKIALSTFSSDAISSTAYATEEILFVIAVGASSLAVGLSKLVPIAIAVAILIAIVSFSYRQTIFAYPNGGGSYIVSRENLGTKASLVAGASILIDYILTVAVSISSGVAAILSIPFFDGWEDYRVLLCLGLVVLVTLANLRGVKESGKVFAVPTYLYIVMLGGTLIYGLARSFFGDLDPIPFDPEKARHVAEAGGSLGLIVLLRGFSSGAVALTGIEAIADGVPAFEKPATKNAATTLMTMAVILATLFMGVSVLASRLHPFPTHDETVISQMGRAVLGGGPLYWILQFATVGILTLAANTAYADFPRLSSIIARDGYLPRQFGNQGDRLVFSNGVIFLAIVAGVLIVGFGGITTSLIPLYAVGVFTSFTLSQAGMFRHQQLEGKRLGAAVSAVGAVTTLVVLVIVAYTKFSQGAWVPIVVVPAVVAIFLVVRRHYDGVSVALEVTPEQVPPPPGRHTFVVLVSRVHRGVVEAINYAVSLRPDHVVALHIAEDPDQHQAIQRDWQRFGFDLPLEIVDSPYRELIEPVERYLDQLDARWSSDRITVVLPEFVVGIRSLSNVLHGQQALSLKLALLGRPNTIVVSVPFHIGNPLPPGVGVADSAPGREPATAGATQPASSARKHRRTAGTDEIHNELLRSRFGTPPEGTVSIGGAPLRQSIRVTGEVISSRVVPRAGSPWLELTLDDGTGRVRVIFTGRRKIPGIEPGRALRVEGVAREDQHGRVLLNPHYTLLS